MDALTAGGGDCNSRRAGKLKLASEHSERLANSFEGCMRSSIATHCCPPPSLESEIGFVSLIVL
ncbi:hypothetical protein [Agrobacterium tumefaciens]|uniref:hypothetical protein n=1 Tax=Agrobacterium tumefaciens TaxID=358 RepID=UPI001571F227|nr:hypothetical protein [Agrobacterium tumefaciens]NSX89163.1 hypothetical protein [Agrobacterium tumefaciens]